LLSHNTVLTGVGGNQRGGEWRIPKGVAVKREFAIEGGETIQETQLLKVQSAGTLRGKGMVKGKEQRRGGQGSLKRGKKEIKGDDRLQET